MLNPRRLIGAYEMLFDSVFMLRSELPALFELATSVAAVVSVSALGCALVHALSRRLLRTTTLSLLALLCLSAPDAARALDLRHDMDTDIAKAQVVDETLVFTGDRVSIDGTVDGDLYVGAERFTLRGAVTGSLYVFGNEVEIDGRVGGSIIALGERVRVGADVGGAVVLGGDRLTVDEAATIRRDVTILGEGARVEGMLKRDLSFVGDWIEVRAAVARDLHVMGAERVALLDGAQIGGDLRGRFWGPAKEIEMAPTAAVLGTTSVVEGMRIHEHVMSKYSEPSFYLGLLVAAAAAFVFGLLLYLLDPRLFEADAPDARSFFRSLGIGFALLLAGPFAILLIGFTVVGIPVAVLLAFILISALYSAYVLVAGLLGLLVLRSSGPGLGAVAPTQLVGVLILSAASALPFVGTPLRIVAVLFGLGCLFERVRGLHALNLRGVLGTGSEAARP